MTDPATIAARNKQLIRETIAGYAAAAEVIEQERIDRLRHITPEESRADYLMLVDFHREYLSHLTDEEREGLRRLEEWRLREKITMRQVFENVARAQGLL
jgi:hypothetical protein